jgi:hypothetical protein
MIFNNENVLYYHSLDSFTEYTQSIAWSGVAGDFVSGIIGSSGLGVLTGGNQYVETNTSPNYDNVNGVEHLTIAFWSSGFFSDDSQIKAVVAHFGNASDFDRSSLGISRVSVNSYQPRISMQCNASGIYFTYVPLYPLDSGLHFTVIDLTYESGSSGWRHRISIDGSGWQDLGVNTFDGTINSNASFRIEFIDVLGSPTILDEVIVWSGSEIFTNQELSNLYDLYDVYGLSMDQYTSIFGSGINLVANLFTQGHENIITSGDLFVRGYTTITNSGNLFVGGSGIISESGNFNLFVNGYEPKPALACPTLDPTAAIQISDNLINTYQSRIDALINQLGKSVLLEFDPIITQCPNCLFDTVRKRSRGIYRTGGPTQFARGRKCPYCKGKGFLETAVRKCIRCLISWNAKDNEDYGISVMDRNNVVRFKTYLYNFDDLVRAKFAISNYDIMSLVKLRVRRIKQPIIVGLREDRYCISFWELI